MASARRGIRRPPRLALLLVAGLGLALAGCGSIRLHTGGRVEVVAAESVWGSIAAQLGGSRAQVHSIISGPAQDPHAYEPLMADARAFAVARLAIVNGVGYDPWAPRLLEAGPASGRLVLDVGRLLGLHVGENPHRWYDPADVRTVAAAITADLARLDPRDAAYFAARHRAFLTERLAAYFRAIAGIRRRYSGVPVGASESIFAMLAPALGLRLITPPSFMRAVAEGTEVSAQDELTAQQQIDRREIRVWVYNSQNATPAISQLGALARAHGIPVVTITETLTPPGASFQAWQVTQLGRLARALHAATGR